MNRSMPGLPVHHQLLEFTQTHAHRVVDAIQPSHPLSSPSSPAPHPSQHQGLFQWVNSSHEVAKVLKFQLQHQSFQWTPRTYLLQGGLVGSVGAEVKRWCFKHLSHQLSGSNQSGVHMLLLSLKLLSSTWAVALVPVEELKKYVLNCYAYPLKRNYGSDFLLHYCFLTAFSLFLCALTSLIRYSLSLLLGTQRRSRRLKSISSKQETRDMGQGTFYTWDSPVGSYSISLTVVLLNFWFDCFSTPAISEPCLCLLFILKMWFCLLLCLIIFFLIDRHPVLGKRNCIDRFFIMWWWNGNPSSYLGNCRIELHKHTNMVASKQDLFQRERKYKLSA